MKKFSMVFALLLATIILTGCGKDAKVVCTQKASGVDITFNIGIKSNVIETMDLAYDMDLSKYSDKQIESISKQDFCTRVRNSVTMFKESFANCKQDIKNKKLNVKADLDVNKLAKSTIDKNSSPEKAKQDLEKVGYKCTIN